MYVKEEERKEKVSLERSMLQESGLNKKHTTYNCPEVTVFVQPSAEPKSNHNTKIWNRGLKALVSLHIYK